MTDQKPMSFRERMALTELVLNILCTTVWVFLRKNLGYRLLSPIRLFVLAVVLAVFAQFTPGSSWPLRGYAIAMLAFGLVIRRRRWIDFQKGRLVHSRSTGDSYLAAFLPIDDYIVRRFVEPILLFVIGLIVIPFASRSLGVWLVFSSGMLAAVESQMRQKSLDRAFDMQDARCEAEEAADTVDPGTQQAEAAAHAGLVVYSTALTNDLQNLIQRREGW